MCRAILLKIAILLVIIVSGCKKNDNPVETPQENTTITVDNNGGTINSNNVSISVQPGTFNGKVDFSVSKDSNVPIQVDASVGKYDKNNVYKITTTSKDSIKTPIRITIPYDPSIIPAGYSEADLTVVHIKQNSYEFVQAAVDVQNRKLTFETNSFSWFSAGVPTNKVEFPTVYTNLNQMIDFENVVVPSSVVQSYDYSTGLKSCYWGVMQVPTTIDQGGNHKNVVYASRYKNGSINSSMNSDDNAESCMVYKLDLSNSNSCSIEFDYNSRSNNNGILFVEFSNSSAISPLTNWNASWANLLSFQNNTILPLGYYGDGTWLHIKLDLPATISSLIGPSLKVFGSSSSKYNYIRFRFHTWNVGNYPSAYGPFIDNVIFKTEAYNEAPSQPSNPTPSNNANNIALNPTLSWDCSDPDGDPLSYDVYFGQQNPPTTKMSALQQNNTFGISGLTTNTTYYWQIFAKDNHNNMTGGPVWKFSTVGGVAPQAPTLLSPLSNSTDNSISTQLKWNASNTATNYNLQVATDNSFSNSSLVVNENVGNNTSKQLSGLNYGQTYYWKVAAVNSYGTSSWSNTWNFTTGSKSDVPLLSSPANGSTNEDTAPIFIWNNVDNATSYTLQVSLNSSFSSFIFNQGGITKTYQEVTGLSKSKTYYWRVSSTNNFGTSAWSSVWSFTTSSGIAIPLVPTLSLPINGAINQSTSPTLTWNASSGATSYTLQVSTSNSFSSFVYNQSGLTNTSQKITSLENNTTYYWRVNATNSAGTSSLSSVWSFTTASSSTGGGAPCPGTPTVTYAGKTYNTVQIGTQCWLKENLDVGTMIKNDQEQTNNGIIEKYCNDNDPNNCSEYGGLYEWAEAVQYKNGATNTTSPNPAFNGIVQGICPTGWHIPIQTEFNTLSSVVNNNSNSLKAQGQGFGSGAGTNSSGFSSLFAGFRVASGGFTPLSTGVGFWSCTDDNINEASHMYLWYGDNTINMVNYVKIGGFSVRCVKD